MRYFLNLAVILITTSILINVVNAQERAISEKDLHDKISAFWMKQSGWLAAQFASVLYWYLFTYYKGFGFKFIFARYYSIFTFHSLFILGCILFMEST